MVLICSRNTTESDFNETCVLHRAVSPEPSTIRSPEAYLTESFLKVILQKSIPTQIRQLILDYYKSHFPHKSMNLFFV